METKAKIIETFYQLVADRGYSKASIGEVSKKSNISKEEIYKIFSSKEDLLRSVLDFVFSKDEIIIFKMENLISEDYKDKLIEMGKNYIDLNKKDKHYTKFRNEFIMLSLRDKKIKSFIVNLFYEYMELFRGLLHNLQKEGLLRKDYDIDSKAAQLFIILDTIILYQAFQFDLDYEKIWVDFVEELFSK